MKEIVGQDYIVGLKKIEKYLKAICKIPEVVHNEDFCEFIEVSAVSFAH